MKNREFTEVTRITLVIHNGLCLEALEVLKKIGVNTVMLESARTARIRIKTTLLDFLGFSDPIEDSPTDIIRIIVHPDDAEKTVAYLIEKLDLSQCVYLPGTSTDVFNDIASSRLFVLSSNYEGMPNALIEAMCIGLPCISTKVSGATDLIINDENGCLIDTGDEEQLYQKMEKIIKSEAIQNSYANNAILLNKVLNVDLIMNKWIDYISSVEGEFDK